LLDAEGNEWFNPIGKPPRRSAFTPGVGLLGEVDVPADLKVYEIGSDYVLGRWTDPTNVEYVRKYALFKH
jgi:hypothetical protein